MAVLTDFSDPKSLGYRFPAEFEPHVATWLSWPHKEESWPGKIGSIYPIYAKFVSEVSKGEKVRINVNDDRMKRMASDYLTDTGMDMKQVSFFLHLTNDAWCRDHGPAFIVNENATPSKIIIDWGYNAWGDKYPPYDLDDQIPTLIGKQLDMPVVYPGIIMEGGAVDFNGKGTVLTTTSCLLNKNRNPGLTQKQIEGFLEKFYGVSNILWLGDGIEGDDTDGHIDDLTRFVNATTVVTVVEDNKKDPNYTPLKKNVEKLKMCRLENGKPIDIIELPMPERLEYKGQRLPASYANFYIANACVVVPIFEDKNDDRALDILQACFPDKKVIGLDSRDIVWGLGSFHCLSQQEPVS